MRKNLLLLSIIATFFTNCNTLKNKSAQVIDSEVEGLEYQCSGLIEYTDKNGTLKCSHTPLAFKIGEIRLGHIYKIPDDGIILPQDIARVKRKNFKDKNVIKIITILQSLDDDKNPENGIKITKKIREKLNEIPIDIREMELDEIKEIIKSELGDINFTTPSNSLKHLRNSMKRFNIQFQ